MFFGNDDVRLFGLADREEIKATITSFSPSYKTRAGLTLAAVKSVNGKGMSTILPFNCS
jgi:hypothetical protein